MENDSDRNERPRVLHNNKARAGVLSDFKHNKNKKPKHGGIQRYCVIRNRAGIPDHEYMPHSAETCFGNRSNQVSLKKGLGGNLGNRYAAVKNFNKSEENWNNNMKALKKQNKILYIMVKCTGPHREINTIKNILYKVSKKDKYSSSIIYISNYNFYLSTDSV